MYVKADGKLLWGKGQVEKQEVERAAFVKINKGQYTAKVTAMRDRENASSLIGTFYQFYTSVCFRVPREPTGTGSKDYERYVFGKDN